MNPIAKKLLAIAADMQHRQASIDKLIPMIEREKLVCADLTERAKQSCAMVDKWVQALDEHKAAMKGIEQQLTQLLEHEN